MTVMGAVLAGGASRRMGTPKEGVALADGRPMLQHVLESLRGVTGSVAVVGACRGVSLEGDAGVVHVLDEAPGEGPLAGLVTLLGSGLADAYLMAACDQPFITPALLRRLMLGNARQPRFFRAPEGIPLDPFPGYFPACLHEAAQIAFRAGERSLRRFVAGTAPAWIDITPADVPLLRDLDTPEDVSAVR